MVAKIGKWCFILGVAIAFISGAGFEQPWFAAVLAALGLLVGFLNVASEETRGFLLAAIALMLSASALDDLPVIGEYLTQITTNVVSFIGAAVLVVALKTLLETAKE